MEWHKMQIWKRIRNKNSSERYFDVKKVENSGDGTLTTVEFTDQNVCTAPVIKSENGE